MVKYHINNKLIDYVVSSDRFNLLSEEEHVRLYNEIKNAILQGIDNKLLDKVFSEAPGINDNKVQSLLLWVLRLTNIKPTESQKIKSAGSYADVDSDFEQNKRQQVIGYIRDKYGFSNSSQIATFGTMAARGSIRNAARALGYSVSLGEKIAKFISDVPGITIQECIDLNKDFQKLILEDKEVKHIINIAKKLEGLPNTISVHASGILIADIDITNYFPLMTSSRKDSDCIISQWEYKDCEANFVLKWDILGLKTLDVMHFAIDLIKSRHKKEIDINAIDVNDNNVFKLMHNGFNTGIFQAESETFRQALMQMKPNSLEDMAAINAIERPGCLQNGIDKQYILAKNNGEKYDYGLKDKALLDKVWDICSETYGLMIYQEQTQRCAAEIAGLSDIESDNFRRSIGKKLKDEMEKLRDIFVSGGVKNGYNKDCLNQLFDQIEAYSGYQFNKSHALAYSINGYQTAWLSYYYPLEFFTSLLTIDSGKTDDVRRYIKAIKERGYKIQAPSINKSINGFTITENGILFGLDAIKGVGAAVSKKIINNRPKNGYRNLGHFINRNYSILNSKILESYTKAGCFSCFGINKESVLESIPYILDFLSTYKNISAYTIFDLCKINIEEYIENCILRKNYIDDNLQYEIDSLGLYITEHPMESYSINNEYASDLNSLKYFQNDDIFITVGAISGIEIRKTKSKMNMCSFNITDENNNIKCIMFPKAYSQYLNSDIIKEGKLVAINCKVKIEDNGIVLIVNEITDKIKKYLIEKEKDKVIEFYIRNYKFLLEKR